MTDDKKIVNDSPLSDLETLVTVTLESYDWESFETDEGPIERTHALIELAATAIFWILGDNIDDDVEQVFASVKSRALTILERNNAAEWVRENRPGRLH
jgi:hypothetical protein